MPSTVRNQTARDHRSRPYSTSEGSKYAHNNRSKCLRNEQKAYEERPKYHKAWYESRHDEDAVILRSSTGLLFAVSDYYLKANSPYMKELLTKLPESSSEKRTIDFKAFHPQVISLVLDFVSNRGDRLSQINRAQKYIQVKAFADRFAHRGLFDRLNQIRDAVTLSDPLGFMQILVDEAVSFAQGAHMKSKMKGIIRDISQLTNNSEAYKGTISSIAWDLLSEALAASGSSAIPSLSHRKQPTQSKQSTQVTSEIKHRIQDDVTSLIRELKTAFTSDAALDDARNRMYTSDEMRDVIYALKDQFYITSENHYPARWSSYNESIYGNDITEWDTPARALSTKTAQSLGMPFYRAFTFSLDEVLVQHNFRSGYLRDPRAPLPHHPQLHELSATADQVDEVILLQQDQPRGPSTESTSTSVPREITPELDLRSMLGDASPTLRSPTPESTVLLPKTFSISLTPPTPAPASLVAPHQQAAHSQLSDTSIVCGYRSTSRHPSASPASNLNWEPDGTFRTPPSQTLFHTVGGKKNAQPKTTQPEVKDEPEAISDSRKDEYEYSGLPLWQDVWQRMKDYLKAELNPSSGGFEWDESEPEESDDTRCDEYDRSSDMDMREDDRVDEAQSD